MDEVEIRQGFPKNAHCDDSRGIERMRRLAQELQSLSGRAGKVN